MPFIADVLALLTLLSDILLVLLIGDLLLVHLRIKSVRSRLWNTFSDNAILFGFIISFTSMVGSLYYSDYLGYAPCLLCWYQRICMYPLAFLFALALWKRDRTFIWTYSAVLSLIGAAIALFHYYIQVSTHPIITLPCSAAGYSASCTETFSTSFGYITIPMMAITAFVLILFLKVIRRRNQVV